MKRNLLGILAVVIAIGFSAFSTKRAVVYFNYSPPSGSYSEGNVETEARWLRVAEENIICDDDLDEKACTIGVESSFLEDLTAANLDAADTNNDLFVDAEVTAPAKVLDVKQGSITGTSISPVKNNTEE